MIDVVGRLQGDAVVAGETHAPPPEVRAQRVSRHPVVDDTAPVQIIAPIPVASELTVEVEYVGTMPKEDGYNNIASPQPYGNRELFLISHVPPKVFSVNTRNGDTTEIFGPADLPAGNLGFGEN